MSRVTDAGEATVTMVCELFGVSRQAYYASRQGPTASRADRRPRPTQGVPSPELLARVRAVLSEHPAWGTARCGRRCGERACARVVVASRS